MKTFRFRLESLSKLYIDQRDEKRAQLAEAFEAQDILAQKEEDLTARTKQNEQLARMAADAGEVNVDRLLQAQRYDAVLAAERGQVLQAKEMVEKEIERRRLELVEADKQVKMLEKLRDRSLDLAREYRRTPR